MVVLPRNFLSDLETVSAGCDLDGFLADLDTFGVIQPASRNLSRRELEELEGDFIALQSNTRASLRSILRKIPPDDPLLDRTPISLFRTIGLGRRETAHTQALAWLLDDKEHGFGHMLGVALVGHVARDRNVSEITIETVNSEYSLRTGRRYTRAGRIDLVLQGTWREGQTASAWVLALEAKIGAEEGEDQLAIYDGWLGQQETGATVLKAFLTPTGRSPESSDWTPMSFIELANVLRGCLGRLRKFAGYHFLRYYLTGVLQDICGLSLPVSDKCEDPYAALAYVAGAQRPTEF